MYPEHFSQLLRIKRRLLNKGNVLKREGFTATGWATHSTLLHQLVSPSMAHVFKVSYIFQICSSVIRFVCVNMINGMSLRAFSNESSSYENVYAKLFGFSFSAKICRWIWWRSRVPCAKYSASLCASAGKKSSNATHITNFIERFIVGNRLPYFIRQFFSGKFKVSHAVHSVSVNGLVRPVRVFKHSFGLLCILACFWGFSAPSYAQQALIVSNQDILKPCEQAIDELRVRRVEVEGLREQIRLRDERDADKDKLIVRLDEIANFWKTAALERKDALNLDDRIERIRIEQIAEYKEELNRLRIENDKLRRGKARWFMAGVVLGAVAPKFP